MDISSLLFSCEHPKKIRTRDGRSMVVSCGKCLSCIVQRQKSKTLVCNEQEKLYKYTHFVTLTYAPEYVPKAEVLYLTTEPINGRRQYVELYDVDDGLFLGSAHCPHHKVKAVVSRSGDGYLHYARYSDVQKFIKRLRRKIDLNNLYKNEKIKYYCVSEYGPRNFRPHFHLLLYHNCPELAQDMAKIVCSSWTYGYHYTTLSKGHCSSYVASYVNSFVSLPAVLQICSTYPKCSHSSCMGLPLSEEEFKEIYKNEPSRLVRYVKHDFNGLRSSSAPWRSFKAYLFPKCYGYSHKSLSERYRTYNVLFAVKRKYGKEKSISELSDIILRAALNDQLPLSIKNVLFRQVDDTFIVPTLDIIKQRLYQSNHFNLLCKKFAIPPLKLVSNIDTFYSRLDYQNLKEQYQLVEESQKILSPSDYELYSKSFVYQTQFDDTVDINGIIFDGDLIRGLYFDSPMYKSIVSKRKIAYQKSIKHKYLNDLNNVLL